MGFHDVTMIDMGDAAEPAVSEDDLSLLRRQWPVSAIQSMTWMQSDLDDMRSVANKRYRHSRPGRIVGSTLSVTCIAMCRCPVSWCTVWKGTPPDCMDHVRGAHDMDHVRGAHDVPPDINSPASTGSFLPGLFGVRFGLMPFDRATRAFPRTCCYSVRYTCRWRIITGCFTGGCPISRSKGTIWTGCGYSCHRRRPCIHQCVLPFPAPGSLGSTGNARPGDVETESPRKTRRIHGRKHVVRIQEALVCEKSTMTVVQDVRELAGNIIFDCRPPILPVSILLHDFRGASVDRPAAPSSLAAAPAEETPGCSGSVREQVTTPRFAEAPADDTGTDLEDELEYVSPLPMMISPLPDSDAAPPVSPSRYLDPPLPALAGSSVPIRVGNALPTCDQFPLYDLSPECSLYPPLVSPVTTNIPDTPEFPSPGSPVAMDRILAEDGDLALDGSSDLPSLPLLLLPIQTQRVLSPEPVVAPSAGASPVFSLEGL